MGLALVLALTGLRLVLGPVLVLMAYRGVAGAPAVAVCVAAFASDYYDGVLARRFGMDTPAVRRFDSATDTVFFLCAAWAAWLLHADLLRPWAWMALAVVALECARYGFDLAKFRREAAYHAWSAKAWGLSLFAALVALLGFGSAVPLVPLALALGIVADAEGLAMSVILPVWTHDVKSIAHARRIRGEHRPATFDSVRLSAGAPVLVLAPHPDDFDAIGVTMRLLHGRGHALHVAVTQTGASGVDDGFCDPPTAEAKAALREGEQRASLAFFGLPAERLRFLRLREDAAGHALVDAANTAVVAALLREVRPAAVFLPHGHDTSVGHQRTHGLLQAAVEAIRAGGEAPTLTVFLNRDPKTIGMRVDVVTPYGEPEAEWKGELLRCHRSQQERNLRSRGRGFHERILEMDRDTAASCRLSAPYAEAFELERFDTPSARA